MPISGRIDIWFNKFLAFMGSCDGSEYVEIADVAAQVDRLHNEVTRLHRENARLITLLVPGVTSEGRHDCDVAPMPSVRSGSAEWRAQPET